MKRRVAVIGANGQIGKELCRALAASASWAPVAVVRSRLSEAVLRETASGDYEIRRGSVAGAAVSELLRGCETVVNCSYASGNGFAASRLDNFRVMDAILSHPDPQRVLHLSSVAVYGDPSAPGASFDDPAPLDAYGREKLAHERHACEIARARGRTLVIARAGHVYGAGHVMSRFILDRLDAPSFALPYGGSTPSNCVSIGRLVSAVEALLSAKDVPTACDVVDSPNKSWREVFELHAGAAGTPGPRFLDEESGREAERRARRAAGAAWPVVSEVLGPRALFSALARAPGIRARADALLAALPDGIEGKLRSYHVASSVAAQIAALLPRWSEVPVWMFYGGVRPGHEAPGEAGGWREADALMLAQWRAASRASPFEGAR